MSATIDPYELVCIVTGALWTPAYMDADDGSLAAYPQEALKKDGTLRMFVIGVSRQVVNDDGLLRGRSLVYHDDRGWTVAWARHVPEREVQAAPIRIDIRHLRYLLHLKETQLMALYGPKEAEDPHADCPDDGPCLVNLSMGHTTAF